MVTFSVFLRQRLLLLTRLVPSGAGLHLWINSLPSFLPPILETAVAFSSVAQGSGDDLNERASRSLHLPVSAWINWPIPPHPLSSSFLFSFIFIVCFFLSSNFNALIQMTKEHHQCKVYCAHDCKSDNICVQTLVFNCDVQIIFFWWTGIVQSWSLKLHLQLFCS